MFPSEVTPFTWSEAVRGSSFSTSGPTLAIFLLVLLSLSLPSRIRDALVPCLTRLNTQGPCANGPSFSAQCNPCALRLTTPGGQELSTRVLESYDLILTCRKWKGAHRQLVPAHESVLVTTVCFRQHIPHPDAPSFLLLGPGKLNDLKIVF